MQNAPVSEAHQPADARDQKKKSKKRQWFKAIVSTLIAIVTIVGAWVAWRAQVAGGDGGDNDARGLLALQNNQETVALSYIQANSHEIAYTDYLRNRKIAIGMMQDGTVQNALDPESVALQITQTLDLANTNKYFFFPGRYLDQNDQYDFNREVNELYAKAEQEKDLDFQKYFDASDASGDKVMGLIALLIVLAASLWLLALSEILVSAVKYMTGLGGLIFLIIGGVAAYIIDADLAAPGVVGAVVWPVSLIAGGLTLVLVLGAGVLVLASRGGKKRVAVATHAGPPPEMGYTNPPPGYGGSYPPPPPPPGYPPPPANTPTPVYVPTNVPPQYQGMPPAQGQYPGPVANMNTPAPPATQAREEEEEEEEKEEPFKQIVTVLIATVALIATLIAYLQADASNQAGGANRNVQQYALDALGERTYGESQLGYHYYTAAQAWKQLDVLATSSDRHGNSAAAARYRSAMDAISQRTDIFDAKYFDPDTDVVPNSDAYAADLYVTSAADLAERSVLQLALHSAWDDKANAYIAHLTLLAVALALFGLGLAISGFVRYIFAVAGVLMVSFTIVWAMGTFLQSITTISDEAVDAYAIGYGDNYAARYQDAVDSLNKALDLEPGYANALAARADAYLGLYYDAYSDNYYSTLSGDTDAADKSAQEANDLLQKAIDNYEAARTAGKDDVNVNWNLGWAYYLQGKYDEAIQTDDHVLELDSTTIGVRMNRAIALLASGRYEDAELEYNTAIARTSDLVTDALDKGKTLSADFWYYLNAGVGDLFNLALRMEGLNFYFTEAPPGDTIADPKQTESEDLNTIIKLRNKIAIFEYQATYGKMPDQAQTGATVDPFEFGAVVDGQSQEATGIIFPSNTKGVNMYYSYQNIPAGSRVSFKVYINFFHYPEYDYVVDDWENPVNDSRKITVTDPYEQDSEAYYMAPGLYEMEMYVDNQYVQSGIFYVQSPAEEQATKNSTP